MSPISEGKDKQQMPTLRWPTWLQLLQTLRETYVITVNKFEMNRGKRFLAEKYKLFFKKSNGNLELKNIISEMKNGLDTVQVLKDKVSTSHPVSLPESSQYSA